MNPSECSEKSHALRLGIVCKSFETRKGGHETYWYRVVNRLRSRGYELHLFAEAFDESLETDPGISCTTIPVIKLGQALRKWTFAQRARRRVEHERGKLDLVLTTGNVNFGDLYRAGGGVHAAYLQECGRFYDSWTPKNLIQLYLQKQLFGRPPYPFIMANSNMVKQQIISEYDTPSERITVIYNGVDTDRFNPESIKGFRQPTRQELNIRSEDFVCLFVGGSWRRKGLPELLKAFGQMDERDVKLIVAGRTKSGRARRLIKRNHLSDRVQLLGYVEQIEKYYAAADALVFPSKYDAGANVVTEALASGCPVITTRTNGTHELITDGNNGYVIDHASKRQSLIEAIQKLKNIPEPDRFRQHAAETGGRFSLKRHLDELTSWIQGAAKL